MWDPVSSLKGIIKVTFYIMIGFMFYRLVERKDCSDDNVAAARAGNSTICVCDVLAYLDVFGAECTQPWDASDCFYFVMVTMSTVGYGDFSPSYWYSKLFTILYIFVGIIVAMVEITKQVSAISSPMYAYGRVQFKRVIGRFVELDYKLDLDGDGDLDIVMPKSAAFFFCLNMAPSLIVVLVIQLICAAVFRALELPSFGIAFYHCLITATTVGYGDVPITTSAGQIWAFFHILISVSGLASIIADFDSLRTEYSGIQRRYTTVTNQMNLEYISALNTNGDNGVDRYEYVIGMLLQLGLVDPGDVELFESNFKRYDRDSSGMLTQEDFERLCHAAAEKQPAALRRSAASKGLVRKSSALQRSSTDASLPRIHPSKIVPAESPAAMPAQLTSTPGDAKSLAGRSLAGGLSATPVPLTLAVGTQPSAMEVDLAPPALAPPTQLPAVTHRSAPIYASRLAPNSALAPYYARAAHCTKVPCAKVPCAKVPCTSDALLPQGLREVSSAPSLSGAAVPAASS